MVAQNIDKSLHTVGKVMDSAEKLANNGQQQSDEEVALKQMERTARMAIHGTLKEAAKIEESWGKSSWGSNAKSKTEDITW
jgi:hypothetical protein